MADLNLEIKSDGIDVIIYEPPTGNSFIALKEIRWDSNKDYKLDIRRWYIKDEELVAGKGISLPNEGVDSLTETLIRYNYGNTDKIIDSLRERRDTPKIILDAINEYCEENKEEGIDPNGIF